MANMNAEFWKPNWAETKRRFIAWWNHEGLLVGAWNPVRTDRSRLADVPLPALSGDCEIFFDPKNRALVQHHTMARSAFPLDILPCPWTSMGAGSLALYAGSEPIHHGSVWFQPCIADPDAAPAIRFDPQNKWWKITEAYLRESVRLADGHYVVGCPDLVENLDIVASLRGSEELMTDMLERPEWVAQKVREVNGLYFDVYGRIYDIIKEADGGSAFWAFGVWGPGKTAKIQCDACCMISADMFAESVAPSLAEQCDWLDYSMYHLDGTQAMHHLDRLLAIESLDALEWTPQAGIPGGGSPQWYDLYREILAAGKSVQALGVHADEIVPLLDAVGGKGLYIMANIPDERAAEDIAAKIEPYRK